MARKSSASKKAWKTRDIYMKEEEMLATEMNLVVDVNEIERTS